MDLSQILSSAEVQAFASGFPVTVVHLIVTLGLFAGLAGLTGLVFWQAGLPALFAVFPAVTLIAFRLGPPGAAAAGFVTGVIALPLTLTGHGPATLARDLDFAGQIRLAQVFVCCVLFTGIGTAVALADQTRLRRMLLRRDRAARISRQRAVDAEHLARAVTGGASRGRTTV